MKKYLIDKKSQLILLLCVLVLIGAFHESVYFILWVFFGVLAAVTTDILIKYFFFKQRIIPKNAIITGFIVSGVINYHEPWYVLGVFCVLAIASKYIIRYKKKHIFNPANLALFTAALFKIPLTWNIESNIYVIIVFGLYMAYSIRKIPHILGFLLFFSTPLIIQKVNPVLLASWFFIFIMLIEPKTSGFGRMRGFIFGSITGMTSFLIFKFSPNYDMFVTALFVANLSRTILDAFSHLLRKLSLSNKP